MKGAQGHANDLPHTPEVTATGTHEDYRAIPEVSEEEGHCSRTWSQLQHGFPYAKRPNFSGNHQKNNER